jgi:hypothetical protein
MYMHVIPITAVVPAEGVKNYLERRVEGLEEENEKVA